MHVLETVQTQIRFFVKGHYHTEGETVLDLMTVCQRRVASFPACYFGALRLTFWFLEQLLLQVIVCHNPSTQTTVAVSKLGHNIFLSVPF